MDIKIGDKVAVKDPNAAYLFFRNILNRFKSYKKNKNMYDIGYDTSRMPYSSQVLTIIDYAPSDKTFSSNLYLLKSARGHIYVMNNDRYEAFKEVIKKVSPDNFYENVLNK